MPAYDSLQPRQMIRGKAFRELLMTRIRQACGEIMISTHILDFDAFGQAVLAELEYACQRGLRVRCILDAQGCKAFISDHPTLLTCLETEFRINTGPLREHGSIIVFDRELAITGSHHLSEPSLGREASSLVVSGLKALESAKDFETIWGSSDSPT